ncbi:MAG: hypothetical protein JKX71_06055 [Amylibacter sp.]|nr:hypothetical protein [Amylibacter sp.]
MKKLMMGIAFGCTLSVPVQAAPIEFRYGLDVFTQSQGTLDALQSISVLREIRPGLHFGQTLYSAAAGDAGGLFIGGFELMKRVPLGRGMALEFGGFIGGGGGAGLVAGDGLMTRGHVTLRKHLFGNVAGTLGFSYIDISGSPVSTPAFNFGLTRDTDFAFAPGHVSDGVSSGRVVWAIKPLIKQFYPQNNLRRNGTPLGTMTLMGFEASFAASPNAVTETFIQATGAAAGDGEGYADIQVGYRWKTSASGLRAFAEVATGFAGGGDVDTGGGFIVSAGGGVALPLFGGFEAEIGAQGTTAIDGDFTALSPYIRASLNFGDKTRPYTDARHWQLTLGATYQEPNSGFRKPGITTNAAPVLLESSIDLFLTDRIYFTGNAQTVAHGDAGGYAIGLLGFGYAMPLNNTWTVSLEGLAGAAGGGGVDTGGGLVGAARVEVDYALRQNMAISVGLGTMQSLRGGGGARPITLHLGIKTAFTTFH